MSSDKKSRIKLLELLSSFNQTDLRRFEAFVASPYFNKNKALVICLKYLKPLAPDFKQEQLNREALFQTVFPKQTYATKKVTYLMSDLHKLGERFLAIEKYQEDEHLSNYHTLNQYVERKLEKQYQYHFKRVEDKLMETDATDGEEFYNKYLVSKVAVEHFYSQQIRKFDPSLQLVSDHLDNFFFFHKIKYSCEMLNRKAIVAADYQPTFMEEVQSYLLEKEAIEPLIEIYLRIYLCLSKPDEESHFNKLMDLIDQHALQFTAKIRREIYLYALNYCAPKIRTGDEKFISIMLDLYIKGIQNRALFDGPFLSHWTYANVVRLALRLQRYDWTERFIKENTISLSPKMREDAAHYNLAELFYHQKEYDQALEHLNQLQFSDLQYHLGSRVILIKIYCEQNSQEALLSLLASFSVYLRRNKKISVPVKKTYLNFCNLLHQILRKNPMKWETLGAKIKQTQPLAERTWLLKIWKQFA